MFLFYPRSRVILILFVWSTPYYPQCARKRAERRVQPQAMKKKNLPALKVLHAEALSWMTDLVYVRIRLAPVYTRVVDAGRIYELLQ